MEGNPAAASVRDAARSCPISWVLEEAEEPLPASAAKALSLRQSAAMTEAGAVLSDFQNRSPVGEAGDAQPEEGWLGSQPAPAGGT